MTFISADWRVSPMIRSFVIEPYPNTSGEPAKSDDAFSYGSRLDQVAVDVVISAVRQLDSIVPVREGVGDCQRER